MTNIVNPWGRSQLMATAAVRYCLGRQTYIVSDCAEWLIDVWTSLNESTRAVILRDIEDEFRRDDEARARGDRHLPLGADMDRRQWERVRRLWQDAEAR